MSEIKNLDQARVAILSRNNSDLAAPQMNRNSIELMDNNLDPFNPGFTPRESNSNVLTQLGHNRDAVSHTFPEQISQPKQAMTSKNPPGNLYRIIVTCAWGAAGGWSDATPGAILPFIEDYYDITYSIVSLIWMANAAGYILIAMLSHKIQPWMGKRYSLVAGCLSSTIMFALVSSGTHFPLVVVGFFFGGMGSAICLSQANIFMSRLNDLSKYLSIYHGCYGLGATVSPLIGTALVDVGVQWNFFYLIILGWMVINGINFFIFFKGADEDLKPWDEDDSGEQIEAYASGSQSEAAEQHEQHEQHEEAIGLQDLSRNGKNAKNSKNHTSNNSEPSHAATMLLALQNSRTWLFALFVLFYQGAEVSLAGWVVTFLLSSRQGNPSSVGYVASGFWGGLTLGRLLLTKPLYHTLGPRRAVIVASVISIVLVILGWLVPNVIAAGIFISIAGVTIGPNYPLQIGCSAQIIPRKIQIVSLTIITAFGSSGGAIFPFLVGLVSQKVGTYVVMPIFIALYCCMLAAWIALPNMERKSDQYTRSNFLYRAWQRIW